jgi:hypothetical protein
LIGVCFTPWVEVVSLQQTFNGLHGKVNESFTFGIQWMPHTLFALLAILFFSIQKVWSKRTNIFICFVNVGWALKNYIIFSMCRMGECPKIKAGLYLLLFFAIVMQVMSFLPKIKLPAEKE